MFNLPLLNWSFCASSRYNCCPYFPFLSTDNLASELDPEILRSQKRTFKDVFNGKDEERTKPGRQNREKPYEIMTDDTPMKAHMILQFREKLDLSRSIERRVGFQKKNQEPSRRETNDRLSIDE